MRRFLFLLTLLGTASCASTAATQTPDPAPEAVTTPEPPPGLPARCDDDAVDGLRSEMLMPGASPRAAVRFAPRPGSAHVAIARDNEPVTRARALIAGDRMTIESGDSAVVLELSGGAVAIVDSRRPSKHDHAFRVTRDLFGLIARDPAPLLPAMPIGRGGRWRVVTRDEHGFVASDYEALAIDAGAISLRVTRLGCRKMEPAESLDGDPSCADDCFVGVEWSSRVDRGELRFALDRPLPTGALEVAEQWVVVDGETRTPGSREWSLTATTPAATP